MPKDYDSKYDDMSIVELLTVCEAKCIDYHKGGEILDADAIRAKLGKTKAAKDK